MLRLLRVTNFALIDHLELEFSSGLNLLTGETGSGKSIIIDALGLILGDRASLEMIGQGAETAQVEALFTIPDNMKQILRTYGLSSDENEIIIKRELVSQSKSRAFVNNSLATLQTLKDLGRELVDLQGQGEHHALQSHESQRNYLDEYGGNEEMLAEIGQLHHCIREIDEKRRAIQMSEQERLRRLDLLQFQLHEIEVVSPSAGEEEELQQTRTRLANVGELNQLASRCYDLIYEREGGLLGQVTEVVELLSRLRTIDVSVGPHFDQITNLRYTLEDAAFFLRDYLQSLEFEPDKLEATEARLQSLTQLKRKYGGSTEEVLKYQQEVRRRLEELESHEEQESALEAKLQESRREYLLRAARLSQKRRSDATKLQAQLARELRNLAMERIRFQVAFESGRPRAGVGDSIGLTRHGVDRVEFLVAVNPGEELKPLSKTASGGELSRIYLALRNVMTAEWSSKTMVFDEVDAGIGGRIAELVGRKLKEVAMRKQVICVTHLPQIAAFADRHFHIYKKTRSGRTLTRLEVLEGERRVNEIARMLGGSKITETTTQHAREMLQDQ